MRLYRRIRERLYRGPYATEIVCQLPTSYGMACPVCWQPLTNSCQCGDEFNSLDKRLPELREVFGLRAELRIVEPEVVFVP